MSQVLLFDLDGTLLDSRDAVMEAVADTAEQFAPGQFSREELLARFGESFDDFLLDVAQGKPSPEPLQKALDELGKRPEQALMIGDSRFDVLAAKAAGVPAVVLEWYGREEWTHAIPEYRYPDFQTFAAEMLTVKTKAGG